MQINSFLSCIKETFLELHFFWIVNCCLLLRRLVSYQTIIQLKEKCALSFLFFFSLLHNNTVLQDTPIPLEYALPFQSLDKKEAEATHHQHHHST